MTGGHSSDNQAYAEHGDASGGARESQTPERTPAPEPCPYETDGFECIDGLLYKEATNEGRTCRCARQSNGSRA